MANIKDYLDWRGDIPFNISHFNEIDNLIFSELAYIDLNNIVNTKKIKLSTALQKYFEINNEDNIRREFLLSQDPIPFLKSLMNANRFANLKLFNYVNIFSRSEEKQFCALSIELNYNTVYIAFKGTDKTILGWKEDFNLSFMLETPSQLEAVNYINEIKRRYKNIIIGGHSKGGNLAVYSAVNCKKKIKKRIKKVFNNDGPGFLEEFTATNAYKETVDKIVTIVPETSIIGMLLTRKEEYKVIKSSSKGIWQHDALTWQVEKDHFLTINEIDETSNKINIVISDWLTKISKKERERFVNDLFNLLELNNIKTIEDLSKLTIFKISKLLKTFKKLDVEERKLMSNLIMDLAKEAKKNFTTKTIIKGIKMFGMKS